MKAWNNNSAISPSWQMSEFLSWCWFTCALQSKLCKYYCEMAVFKNQVLYNDLLISVKQTISTLNFSQINSRNIYFIFYLNTYKAAPQNPSPKFTPAWMWQEVNLPQHMKEIYCTDKTSEAMHKLLCQSHFDQITTNFNNLTHFCQARNAFSGSGGREMSPGTVI